MFSYFESSVDGMIPNEYNSLEDICSDLFGWIASARDSCMLTARRFWIANQQNKIFMFSFNNDESTALVNPAQNHVDSRPSSYSNLTKGNEATSKGASKQIKSTNVTSQQTKKHN